MNKFASTPYGYCPICGALGVSRERRLDGDDMCENKHKYKSKAAIGPGSQKTVADNYISMQHPENIIYLIKLCKCCPKCCQVPCCGLLTSDECSMIPCLCDIDQMKSEKELLIEYIEVLQNAAKIASKLRYEDHLIKFMRIVKDSEIEIFEIDSKETI